MRVLVTEYKERQRAEAYRIYISDVLKMSENHLAHIHQAEYARVGFSESVGMVSKRYCDILGIGKKPARENTMTEKEIRSKFINAFKNDEDEQ